MSTKKKEFLKGNKNCAIIFPDDSCNSLGVIRGLAKQQIPVLFLSVTGREISARSRYARSLICPDPKKEERYFIKFIKTLGESLEKEGVLFPINDLGVKMFCMHEEDLRKSYKLVKLNASASKILLNKKLFFQKLKELEVPFPITYFMDEIEPYEAFNKIPKPFIIKPNDSEVFQRVFKEKCIEISTKEQFEENLSKIKKHKLDIVLQEIIPGDSIYMFTTYIDRHGDVLAVCGYDKLRQFPVKYGSGALVRTRVDKTAVDIGLKVLKKIEYIGLAEPEMKYDPRDGKYKFIEINPRSTTQNRLPAKLGFDYEIMAYKEALGDDPPQAGYLPEGVKWVDLRGYVFSVMPKPKDDNITFRQWLSGLSGKKVFAVLDFKDPIPFFTSFLPEITRLLIKLRATAFKKLS